MTFEEWYKTGINNGWVSPFVCEIHDGVPISVSEDIAMEEGEEPCIWIMRGYTSEEQRVEVEHYSAHARWRKPFKLRLDEDQ